MPKSRKKDELSESIEGLLEDVSAGFTVNQSLPVNGLTKYKWNKLVKQYPPLLKEIQKAVATHKESLQAQEERANNAQPEKDYKEMVPPYEGDPNDCKLNMVEPPEIDSLIYTTARYYVCNDDLTEMAEVSEEAHRIIKEQSNIDKEKEADHKATELWLLNRISDLTDRLHWHQLELAGMFFISVAIGAAGLLFTQYLLGQ